MQPPRPPPVTPVTEDTEIVLTKTTTGADPVRAGEDATFEIEVRNTGSSDARDVVVTDLLPPGMSLQSIAGDGWDCEDGTCTRDRIVAGQDAPVLTVVARVTSGTPDGSTLTNSATASTPTPGDDPDNNDDDAEVDVVAEADLALTKEHTGEDAVAGTPTGFEFTVTNNGPSDAVGPLTVTDELPEGMSYISAQAPWTCDLEGRDVTCTLPEDTLPDGLIAGADAPVLKMQVQLAAGLDDGEITNTGTVSSPTDDPNPGNDSDDETVDVQREADVSVTKSHTGPVRIGDELTFTLQVHNDGPSEARDVVVTDDLPTGLTHVSAEGQGWECELVEGQVTCELDGPLPPDEDADPIEVTTTVLPAAYPETVNPVQVETSTPDLNPENDDDTDRVEVPAQVDLSVEKSLVGDLVVGEQAGYELVVTNHGPTSAPGEITVTDLLPEGLSLDSAGGEGWTCEAPGRTVTCTLEGSLDVDATSTLSLDVHVEPGAYPEVTNTARVDGPSEDTDPENNEDDVVSPVTPTVDLDIDKAVDSRNGHRVTYRIEVTNNGPSDTVEPVVVRDRLPRSLDLVRVNGPGWSCEPGGPGAVCTHADVLLAGDTAQLQLIAEIVGQPQGEVVNVATVTGGGDPDTSTDDAAVDPPADEGDPGDQGDQGDQGDPDQGGDLLPSTGGPQLWLLLAGLIALALGTWAIRRSRVSRSDAVAD